MKIYNKLVRDNIPEIMINNGAKPVTRTLEDNEYYEELKKKLLEETKEFLESNNIEEIADIEEVILAILKYNNWHWEKLENIRKNKADKKGSFDKKIFLINEE
ncbi:MAG: nucleoside triphosphate pyrophosphohydrolase [Bacilli bacterium]|nr:nucleoside triphosphate pyrophosphohydrolase [Bacilli bacterium]